MPDDTIEYVALARPRPPRAPVRVNGVAIAEAALAQECRHHQDEADPAAAAARALAIRELLCQRAVALHLMPDGAALDDGVLDALLDRELRVPRPTPDDCRHYYDAHPDRFRRNDIVYASHILFAVTGRTPLALLRRKAEETLALVLDDPGRFGGLARERSNCPSARVDGSLGQLLRGDSAPEFERALFDTKATGILPRLINTRFGFHIVRIDRRADGEPVPFEAVRSDIAEFLQERVRHKATQQYIAILAAGATIEGVNLGGANGPLVQ
jgi:peptidyl-prolyl cis-trans isomerase C